MLNIVDRVIIGGENGHHSHPVEKKWVEEIIEEYKDQEITVFFKQ